MKHFRYYPRFEYCENTAINLLVRSQIRDAVLDESAVYYETTLSDGERPDTLASRYYGDPDYAWVLFYANDIKNPLTDWFYSQREFHTFLTKKYGSVRRAQLNIKHYEVTDDNGQTYIIDERTFNSGQYDPSQLSTVTFFEYEERINEAKRDIKVLDVVYLRQVISELTRIFD